MNCGEFTLQPDRQINTAASLHSNICRFFERNIRHRVKESRDVSKEMEGSMSNLCRLSALSSEIILSLEFKLRLIYFIIVRLFIPFSTEASVAFVPSDVLMSSGLPGPPKLIEGVFMGRNCAAAHIPNMIPSACLCCSACLLNVVNILDTFD